MSAVSEHQRVENECFLQWQRILCLFILCLIPLSKCSLFSNLIIVILGHVNSCPCPILHCEIDDKMNEQILLYLFQLKLRSF